MESQLNENLSHDPLHGYIRFVAPEGVAQNEITERDIIDHPWVQRMRQIRQLQTAWWVYPTAEHSRFQHILGVMHLASQAVDRLYDSLAAVDPSVPSKPFVDGLMRMAGLLHDVGHGPFGHFFDAHFLSEFGLTHERLGAEIIQTALAQPLAALRRSPQGVFGESEVIRATEVAWLIQRPTAAETESEQPRWMYLLRSLFCGIYTVDNMDFVLRDAFMTGLNPRSFDLQRLLHYSFFTKEGLTIHDRGMHALVHFLSMKAELFRTVYFHRTVRAIDLELADLFRESRGRLFPGDPRDHLDTYQQFTEFSLLTDVRRWHASSDQAQAELGERWLRWLKRDVRWRMVCQRSLSFEENQSESSSVFSSPTVLSATIRERLPGDLKSLEFRVDLARHIHRPHTRGATAGENFYHDSSNGKIRPLTMHGLYSRLPVSHTIARIYTEGTDHDWRFAQIIDELVGAPSEDDLTNM